MIAAIAARADKRTASPAVRMTGVSKSFGGIRALDNVDLSVASGEIHALLGENGAGKSTILKILRGVQHPDSGSIEINGQALAEYTPKSAARAGVAMIFQEMSLVPTLTVAQNIFLSHEYRDVLGLIDDRTAEQQAHRLFADLGVDIDPTLPVSELSAGQRQLTEIVKAMSQQARVLILDEPTTALSEWEVSHLFDFLRRLRQDGVTIIYVSHRMDEIVRIADTATILRDGRHVITAPLAELSMEQMIGHIVGRRSRGLSDVTRQENALGETLLELRGVSGPAKPRDVNLRVRRGEVVGVAGLLGSGRSALARVLCGIDPIVDGEIFIRGRRVTIRNTRDALASGIALVPEDRLRQGVVIDQSVASNICLPTLDRLSRWSWMSTAQTRQQVERQIRQVRIKTASPDSAVRTLSGGNQQKVVLAKWLAADPDILVLDEPTSGIDIGSKSEIIALIRELAHQGKAIVLISSELSELLSASDRVLIMSDGRLVRDVDRRTFDLAGEGGNDPAELLQHAERQLQHTLQEARSC
jgi:ribose transport system ATP-binding protein